MRSAAVRAAVPRRPATQLVVPWICRVGRNRGGPSTQAAVPASRAAARLGRPDGGQAAGSWGLPGRQFGAEAGYRPDGAVSVRTPHPTACCSAEPAFGAARAVARHSPQKDECLTPYNANAWPPLTWPWRWPAATTTSGVPGPADKRHAPDQERQGATDPHGDPWLRKTAWRRSGWSTSGWRRPSSTVSISARRPSSR